MANARWQEIHDDLKRKIVSGELEPGTQLMSDHELAEQYAVSRLTAHRALYELQRSGFVVRKRRAGTVVAEPRSLERRSVATIFFNMGQRFDATLFSSINAAFGDEVRVTVAESHHDPDRECTLVRQLKDEVDAIILFPTCAPQNDGLLRELHEDGYPIVCVDRYPVTVDCDAVLTDNYGATEHGMKRLLEKGHRTVAHLTDFEEHVPSTAHRMRAYTDTMLKAGLDPDRLLRTFPYLAPDNHREYEQAVQLVRDALHGMMSWEEPPTAVFCLRDLYAAAAMEAAERLGLRVPEDLEVLAFLDRQSLLLRRPDKVLRIHQDLDEIGRIAVEKVRARLLGDESPPSQVFVPATFHDSSVSPASRRK